VIRIDDERVREHLGHIVRGTVEETLNAMLEAEADDVKNLSQIWAVAPALAKLALRDDQRGQRSKEPPWKRIAEGPNSAT
jgi:hypothetical protein